MSDKYEIVLKNGERRNVKILKAPVYPVYFKGDASRHYKTEKEIKESDRIDSVDTNDQHWLWLDSTGYIRNEGDLFEIFKGLRNPIVLLSREIEPTHARKLLS